MVSDRQVAFAPARVAFPLRAGALEALRHEELSATGQHIDNAIQYRSADRQIIGTIYIYRPGLPHAGVAALGTDEALRVTSEAQVESGAWRIADAGARAGVAIRRDYRNFQGTHASDAAFIKAGRWIVKLRVSGPSSRAAEVDAAMDALLAGIEWGSNPPRAAEPISVAPCAAGEGTRDARALPDPPGAEIAALGLIATFDGGGIEATENGARRDLPSRIPPALCLSSYVDAARRQVPILRAPAGEPRSIDGRTRVLVLLGDNGRALEVIDAPNLGRHIVLIHSMGETHLLGGFDGVPSDRQISAILYGEDPASRPRVTVRFPVDGAANIHILTPMPAAGPALPPERPQTP